MRRGAVSVAVLESVAGAIDSRTFAVPEAEHALHLAVPVAFDLLRTEHRCRCQILIDRRQKFDAVCGEQLLGMPQFQVEAAKRGTAVAGNETGGIEPRGPVTPCLIERNTHQRLCPGQEDIAALPDIAVFESVGQISSLG